MSAEQISGEAQLFQELNAVDLVVADTNRFKIKLGIGEDAYTSLKAVKTLQTLWDVKGAAGAGAAAAASPVVATTFFGGGGGLLSALGFGAAAATPVGWILAAAVVSGGAYYGAMRMASSYSSSRVETIPKFINTPIDLLGATLFDMLSALALKVADFAGEIDESERNAIVNYFEEEWGLSKEYTSKALPIIEGQIKAKSLKEIVKTFAEFQMDNPDCNPNAMRKDIRTFLEEIAHADGDFDEREELAIDSIERELSTHLSTQNQTLRVAKKYAATAGDVAGEVSAKLQAQAGSLIGGFLKKVRKE